MRSVVEDLLASVRQHMVPLLPLSCLSRLLPVCLASVLPPTLHSSFALTASWWQCVTCEEFMTALATLLLTNDQRQHWLHRISESVALLDMLVTLLQHSCNTLATPCNTLVMFL
jgi:hypothetical protein